MLPAWLEGYVGLLYRHGGRGPDAYDCWGLCRLVLAEQFGIVVPAYVGGYPEAPTADDHRRIMAELIRARQASSDWLLVHRREAIRSPLPPIERAGDLILMHRMGIPCHVGIVVAPNWLLHTDEGHGAVATPIRGGREFYAILSLHRHRSKT
jgi:cell wall-associated NlpC family hydrolase